LPAQLACHRRDALTICPEGFHDRDGTGAGTATDWDFVPIAAFDDGRIKTVPAKQEHLVVADGQ